MEETDVPPVHVANIVASSGNTAYGVESIDRVIRGQCCIYLHPSRFKIYIDTQ